MMSIAVSFESLVKEKENLLIDFYADWCEPCKWAEPVLDDVLKSFDGKLNLHKINIDEHPDIAHIYHVMSVPTLVLLNKGKEVWRMRGFEIAPKLYTTIKPFLS